MKEISGGVCAPRGFKAGGICCGIKASSKKRDLALIYSDKPCVACGVFTTNLVKAASVIVSQSHVARGKLRAIIANSGNANACTGEPGIIAAAKMAGLAADLFAIPDEQVAVASTGVIGVPLPIAAIESNISSLADSLSGDEAGHAAALEAIMTTDQRKKDGAVEVEIGDKTVRIGAMAKGSGRIHPNMATMLCFITTDADISNELLNKALVRAVNRSFNRITVDGNTSTNDTVIIMASSEAQNIPIVEEGENYEIFAEALEKLCVKLAKAIARDGEGATKLLTVRVVGTSNNDEAVKFARTVASSSLVKAACFGADANWGIVLCALGYVGIYFEPSEVNMAFASPAGEFPVCKGGMPLRFSEEEAKRVLSEEEIEIRIKIGFGPGKAEVWGCDLTYDYIKIIGGYRS